MVIFGRFLTIFDVFSRFLAIFQCFLTIFVLFAAVSGISHRRHKSHRKDFSRRDTEKNEMMPRSPPSPAALFLTPES